MQEVVHDNKRIVKNTIAMYFRMLVTMAIGAYTSRKILLALGVEDYGIYNVVGGIVTMLLFLNYALSSSTSRHLTFQLGTSNIKLLEHTFYQCLSIHGVVALIIGILSETIGLWFFYTQIQIPVERLDAAFWTFQISVITAMLSIMNVPFSASVISHEKMSAFAWMAIFDAFMKLLIIYCLEVFPYDKLVVYSILMFFTVVLNQVITQIYCYRHFSEVKMKFIWDKKLSKEMFSFAGWSIYGNLAAVMMTQGVNVLLNMFFGPIVNAGRGIAVQVQGVVTKFVGGFQTALNPQITKTYAAGDMANMYKLIVASSKVSFFLLLFLSLPVIIEAPYLLRLWLTIVPDYSVPFFRIIMLISFMDTLASPLVIAANATGKIKVYQQLVSASLLAIVPISYVVLKLGASPISVFVVHLICVVLAQLIRIWLLRKMINLSVISYLKDVVLPIFCVVVSSTIVSLCVYHIFSNETILNLFLLFLTTTIFNGVFIFFIGLKSNERVLVVSKVRRIYKRFLP